MNNDLISREALKEHKFLSPQVKVIGGRHSGKLKEQITQAYQKGWNDCIDAIIDNAPTVDKGYDFGYADEHGEGYELGKNSRPQGDLADEVWKLYEKYQPYLATRVIEFGDELKDLLGKYQKGGAE